MKKKKDRFNKILNILSSNQLMAIYNILQNIIANIDTILGNRCMKRYSLCWMKADSKKP